MEKLKRFNCLIRALMVLAFIAPVLFGSADVYARPLEGINGIYYWNGDLNYPYYSSGNHFGDVFDRSSAYVVANDGNLIEVRVISYSISFESNSIVRDDIAKIIYHKDTDRILLNGRELQYNSLWKQCIRVCRLVLADQGAY